MPTAFSGLQTELDYLGDLIVMELDERYNRETVAFENNEGAEVVLRPGEALRFNSDHYEVTDTDDDAVLINLSSVTVADGDAINVVALARGPAIINSDVIKCQSAAVLATVKTNLATALPDVVFVTEPTVVQTGPIV